MFWHYAIEGHMNIVAWDTIGNHGGDMEWLHFFGNAADQLTHAVCSEVKKNNTVVRVDRAAWLQHGGLHKFVVHLPTVMIVQCFFHRMKYMTLGVEQ